MLLDLERFVQTGQPAWRQLESLLDRLAARPNHDLTRAESETLLTLYYRAAADLNRLEHGAAAGGLLVYLERLSARAYAEVYAAPRAGSWKTALHPRRLWRFALHVPRVFRRHLAMFWLSLALTVGGCLLGGGAVAFDGAATDVLLPAAYLSNPAHRVATEESGRDRATLSQETAFSAELMTHNIRVSLLTLALGVTWGIGTGLLLFTNGIMLGAVAARYSQQGFGWFVAGWLLPHGSFEIPSILIAGQAGFLLARVILGGSVAGRRQRLRGALPDILTLFGGLSLLLIWAGVMEAFFSQHHAPEISYTVKALVGVCQLALLFSYLFFAGRPAEAA